MTAASDVALARTCMPGDTGTWYLPIHEVAIFYLVCTQAGINSITCRACLRRGEQSTSAVEQSTYVFGDAGVCRAMRD